MMLCLLLAATGVSAQNVKQSAVHTLECGKRVTTVSREIFPGTDQDYRAFLRELSEDLC